MSNLHQTPDREREEEVAGVIGEARFKTASQDLERACGAVMVVQLAGLARRPADEPACRSGWLTGQLRPSWECQRCLGSHSASQYTR
jgi:hypothetical protein